MNAAAFLLRGGGRRPRGSVRAAEGYAALQERARQLPRVASAVQNSAWAEGRKTTILAVTVLPHLPRAGVSVSPCAPRCARRGGAGPGPAPGAAEKWHVKIGFLSAERQTCKIA